MKKKIWNKTVIASVIVTVRLVYFPITGNAFSIISYPSIFVTDRTDVKLNGNAITFIILVYIIYFF